MSVPSASLAKAVMPTTVPLAAFSSTSSAAPSVSLMRRDARLVDVGHRDRKRSAW